jgi:hypothetical protein
MTVRPEATVELTDDNYVVGIWFISGAIPGSGQGDILLCLYRSPDGSYEVRYRFRYYNPESVDPNDGKDRKYFCNLRFAAMPEDEEAEKMDTFARSIGTIVGEVDFIPVHGPGISALPALMSRPWVHAGPMESQE